MYDWSVKCRNNINTPTEDDAIKRNVLTCTQGKCWFWTLCSIKCDILLPEFNDLAFVVNLCRWQQKKQVFRLSYKVPDIFVRFLPNLGLSGSIWKTPVFKFYGIPSSGSRADARGQTDWHDEAHSRFFCYSAAVPKNKPVILWILNYDFKVEIAIGSSRRLFNLRCPWKPNWLVECLSVCQEGSHYISTVMQ